MKNQDKRIAVFGAGFGGLSAAYQLKKQGFKHVNVYEAADYVGGLARSFDWHGINCDLAPHRLFTNDKALLAEITALVPCHSIVRNSRICLSGKWIADPVNAIELMGKLPKKQSLMVAWTYFVALLKRKPSGLSFDSYVESKFGSGLNDVFFKPYAEKLFGIPANQISSHWGESKVRVSGIKDMLRRNTKLYFDEFYYPNSGGYGSFVDALYAEVSSEVALEHTLKKLSFHEENSQYEAVLMNSQNERVEESFDVVINTIPLSRLIEALGQKSNLRYKGAKLVYLLVSKSQVMQQQWSYFIDNDYPINRLAEFQNFNLEENRILNKTVLCAEVTKSHQWSDDEIVGNVIQQLTDLKMLQKSDIEDQKVIPISHAYPVYDLDYVKEKARIDEYLSGFRNMYSIGRQAQFMHQDIDEIFLSAKHVVEKLLSE